MTTDIETELETMLDRSSMVELLQSLRSICDAKAEHVASNWQDKELARDWERAANRLDTAMRNIGELSIPQPRK